jgi:hypothetical protein
MLNRKLKRAKENAAKKAAAKKAPAEPKKAPAEPNKQALATIDPETSTSETPNDGPSNPEPPGKETPPFRPQTTPSRY